MGVGNAYLCWAIALYLDYSDVEQLATDSLTDHSNDKKIDFIRLDLDSKKIVFAQGVYYQKTFDTAGSNKASDLNTASAWLVSGDLEDVPDKLKAIIIDCRKAINNGDIEQIDILFVHNRSEAKNAFKEIETVANHLKKSLPSELNINTLARELGIETLERLYSTQESSIIVQESIECPAKIQFMEEGPNWKSAILSVSGAWLRDLFQRHSDDLFSANYRGFLGITQRRKINTGIRQSAETDSKNFWVYNNGITILTREFKEKADTDITILDGISILNGDQTTGSIGSVESKYNLDKVKVLCRVIQCLDSNTIGQIVKYNNTQNEITTWDLYSNSAEQKRIAKEFKDFKHEYSLKRGFSASSTLGIEQVIQPLLAFSGDFQSASRGKNSLFESRNFYDQAFKAKKARHILFVHTLSKAIDAKKFDLKEKENSNNLLTLEEQELNLFRNLRFKNFLIAVIAKSLESILKEKTDLGQIAFTPNAATATNKSIDDLIALWLPAVNIVLDFVTTLITTNNKDLSEILSEDGVLDNIANSVRAYIHTFQALNPISPVQESFKNSVSPKG